MLHRLFKNARVLVLMLLVVLGIVARPVVDLLPGYAGQVFSMEADGLAMLLAAWGIELLLRMVAEPMPYWAMVRFGKWDQILDDKGPHHDTPFTRAAWRYARGMAFTAKDRLEEAEVVLHQDRDRVAAHLVDEAFDVQRAHAKVGDADLPDLQLAGLFEVHRGAHASAENVARFFAAGSLMDT
mgnify:CR=1 FL=1